MSGMRVSRRLVWWPDGAGLGIFSRRLMITEVDVHVR